MLLSLPRAVANKVLLLRAQARLTNRLRWGIAVLQAKNELSLKRQVFGCWR